MHTVCAQQTTMRWDLIQLRTVTQNSIHFSTCIIHYMHFNACMLISSPGTFSLSHSFKTPKGEGKGAKSQTQWPCPVNFGVLENNDMVTVITGFRDSGPERKKLPCLPGYVDTTQDITECTLWSANWELAYGCLSTYQLVRSVPSHRFQTPAEKVTMGIDQENHQNNDFELNQGRWQMSGWHLNL